MRKKKIEVLDFKIDLERPMIMWMGFWISYRSKRALGLFGGSGLEGA